MLVAAGAAWIAAVWRLYRAGKQQTQGAIAYAVATVCVAAAFTVTAEPNLLETLTHVTNLSDPVRRILLVVGAAATQIFLITLRTSDPASAFIRNKATYASATAVILWVLWMLSPVHRSGDPARDLLGHNVFVTLYRAIFLAYLVYTLVSIARLCIRNINEPGDWTRSVGVTLIGAACLLAAAGIVATFCDPFLTLWTGHNWRILTAIGNALEIVGCVALAAGILLPAWPIWRRHRRKVLIGGDNRRLWFYLAGGHPHLLLRGQFSTAARRRRDRVEIHDALAERRVLASAVAGIMRADNQLAAFGHMLWHPAAPADTDAVLASDLLQHITTEQIGSETLAHIARHLHTDCGS